MPFAHFFHCVLILFILTCKLGILRNLVLCYVCCIEVLGHHEEMEQNKHTTTQWIENIAASRKAANLFSSSPPNVTELLPSHSQPLSNEDLIEVQEKRCKEKLPWKLPPPHWMVFTIQRLLQAFMHNKLAKKDFQTHSPSFECSLKVFGGIKNTCGFYSEITRKRIVLGSASMDDNLLRH